MIFRCNTTISILADVKTTDEWGDEMDANVVLIPGIPASVTEVGTASYSENSTRPRVIRDGILRVSTAYRTSLTDNTRIRDEVTGFFWIVMSVTLPNNALGNMPMHVELQRS